MTVDNLISVKPYFKQNDFVLYNGDSIDLLNSMPAASVDMVFADPPYNLSNGGFTVHAGRRVNVNKGEWDKSRGFMDDYDFHHRWLEACYKVLKPSGTLWVSGTYHSIYQCGHAMQDLGFHFLNDIAWFKPNASPNLSCRFFTASHESLIWARKEKKAKHTFNYKVMKDWKDEYHKTCGNKIQVDGIKKKIVCNNDIYIPREPGKQMRSVWFITTPKKSEKQFGKHPTQKPMDLLRRVVLSSTKPGDLILDPFTGSSTTGLVAVEQGRQFVGIDNEPKYLDVSVKRFKNLVG